MNREKKCVGDMNELGIFESLQLKRQVLLSAAEAAIKKIKEFNL